MELQNRRDFEEHLGQGVVRIFEGHPGYCPIKEPHPAHLFEYHCRSGEQGEVHGRYMCQGEGAEFGVRSPCPHARPSWRDCPHCLGVNR